MLNRIRKNIVLLFSVAAVLCIASCEQDDNPVGAGLLVETEANLNTFLVGLTTSNLAPDTIRSDRRIISPTYSGTTYSHAEVGVYDEPTFGKTKADFYAQVRLNLLNPTFGDNAEVDSVVLVLPAFAYETDTIQETENQTGTSYTLTTTDDGDCSISTTTNTYLREVTYALDSLYGNTDTDMTLQVHRVVENMGAYDEIKYSDQSYQVGDLFGEGTISNTAKTRTVITSSGEIDDDAAVTKSTESVPNFHILLDGMKTFVQDEIIDRSDDANFQDQISFVNNVLNGIRLSVTNSNGFLFTFSPNNMRIIVYYSEDNSSFEDEDGDGVQDGEEGCTVVGTQARTSSSFDFVVGTSVNSTTGGYNVFQSYLANTGNPVTAGENQENMYLSGTGGNKSIIKFDEEKINALKDSVAERHWAITEAHLKVYPDTSKQGDLPLPQYLYLYNYTEGELLPDYGGESTSTDVQAIPYSLISTAYSETEGYYLLRITEYIKNIVEDDADLGDLALNIGNYDNPAGNYLFVPANAYFSNHIYNPYRLVAYGGDPASASDKKLQLEINYTKK